MSAANRRRTEDDIRRTAWSLPRFRRGKDPSRQRRPVGGSPSLSGRYLAAFFLVLLIVSGAFCTHLWVRFEGARLGYAASKARDERAKLLLERRELRLELASLKAPARVEAEALEKLGMEVPDHARIIPVGKTSGQLVASGGAR